MKILIGTKNPAKIAARCTVFAESDLVHKAQMGYKKEDIIAGLCYSVCNNYLSNVAKGKKIEEPIIFQGGVSKNIGVQKAFKDIIGKDIIVDKFGHLMGAYGVSILALKSKERREFTFSVTDDDFETKGITCNKCGNNCEIVLVKQNNKLIDAWGNRCENGQVKI